jgi:hypothetical protein
MQQSFISLTRLQLCKVFECMSRAAKVGAKLFGLIWDTATYVTVGMLTAKTGPHTGRYSRLYSPDRPRRRDVFQ